MSFEPNAKIPNSVEKPNFMKKLGYSCCEQKFLKTMQP